jgi:hypothetical protein
LAAPVNKFHRRATYWHDANTGVLPRGAEPMSLKTIFAAAVLAASLSASFGATPAAAANPACDGTVRHYARATVQCYYLPTVNNGRVTGLQEHINIDANPSGRGGAVIGKSNCRDVSVVVGGHTSTRKVCS